jgi:hypothetical protein
MTNLADMAPIPLNMPMQFLVDMPLHISAKDFEKMWSEIEAQFTTRNDIATVDWSSFNALSVDQLADLCQRWM